MPRWSGDMEGRIFGEGGRYEEERHRRGGGWQGGGREWDDRGRERWTGEDRGGEWRGGSRGEDWRGREPERWTSGGEWRGGTGDPYARDWEREDRSGGGWYGQERGSGPRGRGSGEWRGEGGSTGESGSSFGAGGMSGRTGGMYGGSMGERTSGMRRGGSGYGMGEYGGSGRGGEWERGWRDTSRDFAGDLRRHGGEDEGMLDRMGDRMQEGWRRLTGKGPKGYKRSDERIREEVSERIARSGINADDVEVKVESGEVTLTGFVERREDKRRLEDMAEDVFGVDEVNNHLRVHREERSSTTAQSHGLQGTQASTQGTQGTGGQRTQPGTQTQPGRH